MQAENVTSLDDINKVGIAARIVKLVPGVGGHGHVMYLSLFLSCCCFLWWLCEP